MSEEIEAGSLDEVSRLLAVVIRQSNETQADAIRAIHATGLSNARIGQLLGTTTATVRNTVNKSK